MNRKIFVYSVVASILATIAFSYAIQPLSAAAWHLTASASNSVFTWIQDQEVSSAAVGKRDWVSPMLLQFLAAIASAAALAYPTLSIVRRVVRKRLSSHQPDPSDQQPGLSSLRARVRRLYLASAIAMIPAAFCLMLLAFLAFSDLQMNSSFSQRLDALAPYIDVQSEKQLRSRWARMETLSDYRALTTDMDQLAAKAGIKLPKVLFR